MANIDNINKIENLIQFVGFYYNFEYYTLYDHKKLYSSYPNSWLQHYESNRYARFDYVHMKAQTTILPFIWHTHNKEGLTKQQKRIFQEAKDCGINAGITVPLLKGSFLSMTFSSSHPLPVKINHYNELHNDLLLLQCLLSNELILENISIFSVYTNLFIEQRYVDYLKKIQCKETLKTLETFLKQSILPPHSKAIAEESIEDLRRCIK